jgi:alkylated DNA repair dioxygenase AlkB
MHGGLRLGEGWAHRGSVYDGRETASRWRMPRDQIDLFGATPVYPDGFRYQPEMIDVPTETRLLEQIESLPFREFEFQGYTAKRRVISFGWQYDFDAQRLHRADDMPSFLLELREAAALFAGMEPTALQHVLVMEYGPGAAIGWHRDKAVFGEIVGISLRSACTEWEHSIPAVDELRYSVTYRHLRA